MSPWNHSTRSSAVAPAASSHDGGLVDLVGVLVDELPRAGAVEVLRQVDDHARAEVHRAPGRPASSRDGSPSTTVNWSVGDSSFCGLSSTKYSPGSRSSVIRTVVASGDRAVAALDRHRREERRRRRPSPPGTITPSSSRATKMWWPTSPGAVSSVMSTRPLGTSSGASIDVSSAVNVTAGRSGSSAASDSSPPHAGRAATAARASAPASSRRACWFAMHPSLLLGADDVAGPACSAQHAGPEGDVDDDDGRQAPAVMETAPRSRGEDVMSGAMPTGSPRAARAHCAEDPATRSSVRLAYHWRHPAAELGAQ